MQQRRTVLYGRISQRCSNKQKRTRKVTEGKNWHRLQAIHFKARCKITWYKALVLLCNLGEKSAKWVAIFSIISRLKEIYPYRWLAIKAIAQKKPGKNSYIDRIRTRASQIFGTLSKPRRRRQRGHGKTKDLIGRTIAQHVRFKTLYIS